MKSVRKPMAKIIIAENLLLDAKAPSADAKTIVTFTMKADFLM
jgi:hypothetical protein